MLNDREKELQEHLCRSSFDGYSYIVMRIREMQNVIDTASRLRELLKETRPAIEDAMDGVLYPAYTEQMQSLWTRVSAELEGCEKV